MSTTLIDINKHLIYIYIINILIFEINFRLI